MFLCFQKRACGQSLSLSTICKAVHDPLKPMLTAYKNFSPSFGFIAKTHPEPSFFNPRAIQPPKQNIFFLHILVHINSHSK
jgi:hypothetical protein